MKDEWRCAAPGLSLIHILIAVADHTKFGVNAMCGTCDIERIDILVTDKRAPAEMLDEMCRRGIQVVVV